MGLQIVTAFYLTEHALTVALGAVLCLRFSIKPRRCYCSKDELKGAATCWTSTEPSDHAASFLRHCNQV